MVTKYERRKGKGYEVQTYETCGSRKNAYGCDTLEDVAKLLISICNGCPSGNFPTVWFDGELIK